jgi:hypothetical protein
MVQRQPHNGAYPSDMPRQDESASLYGLDPEEALRALLAVDPDDPEHDDDREGDEAPDK